MAMPGRRGGAGTACVTRTCSSSGRLDWVGRCVLEESLVCLGDCGTVSGGEEIEQEAAEHGHAEAGLRPGRPIMRRALYEGGGGCRDPRMYGSLGEPLRGRGAP